MLTAKWTSFLDSLCRPYAVVLFHLSPLLPRFTSVHLFATPFLEFFSDAGAEEREGSEEAESEYILGNVIGEVWPR